MALATSCRVIQPLTYRLRFGMLVFGGKRLFGVSLGQHVCIIGRVLEFSARNDVLLL